MPRIRPILPGFGSVAPGGAAGVGLQAVGQALGDIANLRTNRELFGIREQEQIDRLEFAQFEKVERSEAIVQFTNKQILRNEEAARLLSEARENHNFENVPEDMNTFEDNFDRKLFRGRSQEFQDVFKTIDLSARIGRSNTLATAVAAGNLGIIRDNFSASLQNVVNAVTAASTPTEIIENLEMVRDGGIGLGINPDMLDADVGDARRVAMERLIRSVPVVEGLALLSNKDVTDSFTKKERETLRRDLNVRANSLESNRLLANEVTKRLTNLDIISAINQGKSQSSINDMIAGVEGLSPEAQRDALDLAQVLSVAREKGPQPISREKLTANHIFSDKAMQEVVDTYETLIGDDGITSKNQDEVFSLVSQGEAILAEATRLTTIDQFDEGKLVELGFQMSILTEKLLGIEKKKGGIFALGRGIVSLFSEAEEERVPNAEVARIRRDMFLGRGRYGRFTPAQRSVMGSILAVEAGKIENSNQSMAIEEADKITQDILNKADTLFTSEEFGLFGEDAEEVKGLMINTGAPTTGARQQSNVPGVADSIRQSLDNGKTIGEIEEFMRGQPNFTQEVFDSALAAVDFAIANEPAIETPREEAVVVEEPVQQEEPEAVTSAREEFIETLRQTNPQLFEEENAARAAAKRFFDALFKPGGGRKSF